MKNDKANVSNNDVLNVKKAPTKQDEIDTTAKNRSGCSTGGNSGC